MDVFIIWSSYLFLIFPYHFNNCAEDLPLTTKKWQNILCMKTNVPFQTFQYCNNKIQNICRKYCRCLWRAWHWRSNPALAGTRDIPGQYWSCRAASCTESLHLKMLGTRCHSWYKGLTGVRQGLAVQQYQQCG